jgi:hypothetical protein
VNSGFCGASRHEHGHGSDLWKQDEYVSREGALNLTLTPDERGFLWLDVETAAEKLAHDVPRDIINLMVA